MRDFLRKNLRWIKQRVKVTRGRLYLILDHPVARHPLAATFIGFILTLIIATPFGYLLTSYSHRQDIDRDVRNSAIAAEVDISELTSERRERAALVGSSIKRNASNEELKQRKIDYDKAYLMWNTRVPSDILKFRAGFDLPQNSDFEKLVDGLTNINILLKSDYTHLSDGLLKRADDCVTNAYDAYMGGDHGKANQIIRGSRCDTHGATVNCFGVIAEIMYQAINTGAFRVSKKVMRAAKTACTPAT